MFKVLTEEQRNQSSSCDSESQTQMPPKRKRRCATCPRAPSKRGRPKAAASVPPKSCLRRRKSRTCRKRRRSTSCSTSRSSTPLCQRKRRKPSCGCSKDKITRNPFLNFLRAYRLNHPLYLAVDIAKRGAKKWNRMTQCEKKPFIRQARRAAKPCRSRSRKRSRRRSRKRKCSSAPSSCSVCS